MFRYQGEKANLDSSLDTNMKTQRKCLYFNKFFRIVPGKIDVDIWQISRKDESNGEKLRQDFSWFVGLGILLRIALRGF